MLSSRCACSTLECFVRLSAVHTAEISSSCHLDIGIQFDATLVCRSCNVPIVQKSLIPIQQGRVCMHGVLETGSCLYMKKKLNWCSTLMLLNQRGTRMLMMMPLDLMIGQMVYVDSANCNLLLFIFTRASTFVAPAFQRTVGTRLLYKCRDTLFHSWCLVLISSMRYSLYLSSEFFICV
ncbi:hypothetical protein PVAP13_1KG379500 [Panicum virgatum]|uniref:Uncharacterized protein n=1 Tax=Panicum virgatum TaxID=38727 RepID=A0A8T0XNS5_PANVG|nr:hypothetical protein PVAP13_1KG379500 [Panicum virgatum]